MKKLLSAAALAVALFAFSAPVRADSWETNYAKALKTAAATKKKVLLDFTGSDWCVVCVKMEKEIFSQPAFKDYAKDNLILVRVDFPQETDLPADITKQNQALAQQYDILVFPTIVVLNDAGKMVGELLYDEGGASKFVESLKALPKG